MLSDRGLSFFFPFSSFLPLNSGHFEGRALGHIQLYSQIFLTSSTHMAEIGAYHNVCLHTPPPVPVWAAESGTHASELLMFAVWNIITLLSIFKTKYFTTMCRKHISPESGSLSPANGAFGCGGPARDVQAEGRPAPSALLLSCSHLCPRRFLPRSLVHSVSPVWCALVAPWPTASSFAITSVISLTWYVTRVASRPQKLCWLLQAPAFRTLTDDSWELSCPSFLSASLHPGFRALVRWSCSSCLEQANPTTVLKVAARSPFLTVLFLSPTCWTHTSASVAL